MIERSQGLDLDSVVQHIRLGQAVILSTSVGNEDPDVSHLSVEEQSRAAAFRHEPSRKLFITGRRLLREVLSSFVSDPILELGPHGKPHCSDPSAPSFNVSHAGSTVVAVFHHQGPVGVDVEEIHRTPAEPLLVAEKVFSSQERQRMVEGHESFLDIWTRKEAVLKMRGDGFTARAGTIDAVDLADREGWSLRSFSFPGHVGCVCVTGGVEMVLATYGGPRT